MIHHNEHPGTRFRWPGGKKLAVMSTVMVELWSQDQWPVYAPMATAWPVPDAVDRHSVSWSRYGVTTGAWRLLRVLAERGAPATFGVSGLVCERHPELVRAIHGVGHEIAAHSWTQDVIPALLDVDEEDANITRCLTSFQRLTGTRPTGWMSPRAGSSAHTLELLARHGFRWWGDHNDRDLPYPVPAAPRPVVAIMHSDLTDVRGAADPRSYRDHHQDLLSALLDQPGPGILNLTVHAHVGGRPLMAATFDRVLRDLQDAADSVWLATHQQVADHVLASGADEHDTSGRPS